MGRGSAVGSALVVAAVIGLVMMSQLESVEAAVYTVGDAGGWTFNVQGWPNGKHFRAGDTLSKLLHHFFFFFFFKLKENMDKVCTTISYRCG